MRKRIVALLVIVLVLFMNPFPALAVKVIIDPGHGGSDPGAIGVNGLQEKDVNLDISLKLRDELLRRGYEVVMTRETDYFLSLKERVELADRAGGDLFVSVHANSFHTPDVRGSLVLYYDSRYPQWNFPASEAMKQLSPASRSFAQLVVDAMSKAAGTQNRGLMASSAYVVRAGSMPSILVETAFLSNRADAAMLAEEHTRRQMAIGIANGIEAFRPAVFSDLNNHWAKESVFRLYGQGLVQGVDNLFLPDQVLTRAEFLTIMDRIDPFAPRVAAAAASSKFQVGVSSLMATEEAEADDGLPASLGAKSDSSVGEAVYGQPARGIGRFIQQPSAPADEHSGQGTAPEPLPDVVYPDLSPSHWAYETLQNALRLGFLQGYADGMLRPDHPITRAEVTALFDRVLNGTSIGNPESLPFTPVFEDVPARHWSAASIYKLHRDGLLQGINTSQFAPERPMTRAENAVMIDRYLSTR